VRADEKAAIGDIAGPGLKHEEVAPAFRRVVDRYLALRTDRSEKFIETLARVGHEPFKEALYASA
jgi:sulfite reductase (NADPH) hemoprotein beta-component